MLSDGTGNFDEERLLHQLPTDLQLPEKKVKRAVEDQAKDRKRTFLVQAVSYLRQRKLDDTVKALNNLVACNKVLQLLLHILRTSALLRLTCCKWRRCISYANKISTLSVFVDQIGEQTCKVSAAFHIIHPCLHFYIFGM